VTAFALRQSVETVRLQRLDLAARTERERREHAERITGLVDLVKNDAAQPTDVYEVIVENRSDQYVF
jgi:hypothetical protein